MNTTLLCGFLGLSLALPAQDTDKHKDRIQESQDEVATALFETLESEMEDPDTTLFAWGFDPIYFNNERMTTKHLDQVSATRTVVIMHSNGHLLNVNSAVLGTAEISRDANVHGVTKDGNGEPTGELAEAAAKYMAYRVTGDPFFSGVSLHDLQRFGQAAVNAGTTTATDLFATFSDQSLATSPHSAVVLVLRTNSSQGRIRSVTKPRSFPAIRPIGCGRAPEVVDIQEATAIIRDADVEQPLADGA